MEANEKGGGAADDSHAAAYDVLRKAEGDPVRRMRLTRMMILGCGLAAGVPARGQMNLGSLKDLAGQGSGVSSEQASGGLKEALSRGVSTAVASTGRPGGYFDNAEIKIGTPPKLQMVEKGLRTVGMGPKVDEFIQSMNAAAEEAAPAAKAILLEALKTMTFSDAKGIVTGGKTAGTEYFKRTTTDQIQSAFRPIVERAMSKTGVTEQYKTLMESAPKMPFAKMPSFDINQYVLDKSIDGLFIVMGEEETKIRTNPAEQLTPLLKAVFGKR